MFGGVGDCFVDGQDDVAAAFGVGVDSGSHPEGEQFAQCVGGFGGGRDRAFEVTGGVAIEVL